MTTTSVEEQAAVQARAVARYVRTSASKARRVVDLVRGAPVSDAIDILRFAPQAAARPVLKVLQSAVANAENNLELDTETLRVVTAYVDEGPTLRRFRPRAQGSAGQIRKRSCHITIIVQPDDSIADGQRGRNRNRRSR